MDADFVRKSELEELANRRHDVCISIYLPMVRRGADTRGNHIQLKNVLREIEETLQARDWDREDLDNLLGDAHQLLGDLPFWQHQLDGLALFIAPGFFRRFRLPLDFEPLSVIGQRFHIKPLLPLFSDDGRFYILALSENSVRLFQGTRYVVDEMQLEGIPQSMAEALAYDDPEEQLQYHPSTTSVQGEATFVHHGHDPSEGERESRLRRYLKQISNGIQKQLAADEAPLVLAAVGELLPVYKAASKKAKSNSPHVLEEGIKGNPDELSARELHEKAWRIVEPLFKGARADVTQRYHELKGKGQASDDLHEILPAAYQGRIDTLFVSLDTQKWGYYDLENNALLLHDGPQDGDEDLLDLAALQTLALGGTVYAVEADEMPGQTPIAAVFRF